MMCPSSLDHIEDINLIRLSTFYRRMFPGIVISVGGLEPDLKYSIALEFNPVDNAR